jgi:hypothetical protein
MITIMLVLKEMLTTMSMDLPLIGRQPIARNFFLLQNPNKCVMN